jgi:hypothetical protein
MITRRRCGLYKLVETKSQTKIFYLDNDTYAWVEPPALGELLASSRREHATILSMGIYCVFDVKNEPRLTNTTHLELEVGGGVWQGYLLIAGLPDEHKMRARIVPTRECISASLAYVRRSNIPHGEGSAGVTSITPSPVGESLTASMLPS